MVRTLTALAVLLAHTGLVAQEARPWTERGLLRGSASICPGIPVNGEGTNIYVGGRLEYFLEDVVSIRGEGFWYIDNQQQDAFLAQNSQITFGPFYHIIKDRVDLAFGFEPGLSFVQPSPTENGAWTDPLRAVPNVALCTGLTYAVWDYFHCFVDARYVHSVYPGSVEGNLLLDEFIFGAGLGFHLHTRKAD